MNLKKKGNSAAVCRPRSPMTKSTQDGEEETKSSPSSNLTYLHLMGDLPDLLGSIHKSSLDFRDKIFFSY